MQKPRLHIGRHLVALLATAAAIAVMFGSSVALAADSPVVFSQTDNLWGEYTSQHNTSVAASTYYAPGDTASVYDNFTLGSSASVALITWHGAYYDGPPQPLQPGDPGSNGPGSNGAGSYGYGPADPGTITGFTIRFYSDVIDSSGGSLNGLHRPNLEAGPIHTSIITGNAGETDLHAVNLETIYYGPNGMYSYSAALTTPFAASAGTQYWISIVAESAFPPEWGWDTAGLNGYNAGPGGPWFDPSVSLSYRQDQGDPTLRRNISGGDFTFSLSVDATPPVIAGHDNITVTSATSTAVTYTAPNATDNVDATAPASCTPASGSTFALGTTTVTCNKSDTAGNTATPTTFTVTVNQPPPPVDVCPNLGGLQPNVPDGWELVGGQCVLKPNAPQSVPATTDQPGSVTVAVAPPTSAGEPPAEPVTVNIEWNPGTFTVPVTVTLTPQVPAPVPAGTTPPPPTPVAGGFTVGSTTVVVTVTDNSGVAVHQFAAPLVIHVSASEAGDVPAYSQDGITWVPIPQLSSPSLPDGQPDGYFRNADGSIDIFTRHATLFGLLKDTQAPTALVLKLKVEKTGLRLSWRGSKDNIRVTGYVVSRNGHGYKSSVRTTVVLPLKAGTYTVRARDGVGNVSNPSKAIKVVRTASKTQPFKVKS